MIEIVADEVCVYIEYELSRNVLGLRKYQFRLVGFRSVDLEHLVP